MDDLKEQLARLSIEYEWDSLFGKGKTLRRSKIKKNKKKKTSIISVEEDDTDDSNSTIEKKKKKNKNKKFSVNPSIPKSLVEGHTQATFSKHRAALTLKYYEEFNKKAFKMKLPTDLKIVWSKRLKTTAGRVQYQRNNMTRNYSVHIELSIKVLDNEERLRSTLLHEMCHVAAYLIDGQLRPPHGESFWKWADTAEKRLGNSIRVTRLHSYIIHKPHQFVCSNKNCLIKYGRHSKRGIDTDKQFCGLCQSSLTYAGKVNPDGTPQKTKPASGFSLFVKENYRKVKGPTMSHGEVMRELSNMYSNPTLEYECRD